LIKLDFFKEFGNSKKLMRVFEFVKSLKYGDISQIKKSKVEQGSAFEQIIKKYATDIGANGQEIQSYRISNIQGILSDGEKLITEANISDFSYKEKIQDQIKYLGFPNLVTGKEEDRPKLLVKKMIPMKNNKGYSVITKSIGSGIETRFSLFNSLYKKTPIKVGDVIMCLNYTKNNGFYTLRDYDMVEQ
jgi:hypothetical protein